MAKLIALLVSLWIAAPFAARADVAKPMAADPRLEERVNKLSEELRCLVCQNQTLADSNAPLAVDLKNQVREMMASGRSDDQVVQYMVERYGDFVLYRPPFKATTLLLWGGPVAIALFAVIFLVRRIRRLDAEPDEVVVGDDARRRADELLAPSRK